MTSRLESVCVTWLSLLLLLCCDVESNPGPSVDIKKTSEATKSQENENKFLQEDTDLVYSNPKFEEILEEYCTNNIHKFDAHKVPKFLEQNLLAEFSELAYEDWEDVKTINALPKGWELITTASNNTMLNGYFGVALWHAENKHIVIAHRGTEIKSSGSLFTDLWSVVLEKNGGQMNSACTFILKIKQKILSSDIQLFITGHSLGGWLGQLTTLIVKYFNLDNGTVSVERNENNIHLIHPHTIVFESPGCKDMLILTQKAYDLKLYDRKVDINNLDITNYLTRPNAVNTYGKHVGTVLTICDEELTTDFIHTIKDHEIQGIVNKFKAAHIKIEKEVENLVKVEKEENNFMNRLLYLPNLIYLYICTFFYWLFNIRKDENEIASNENQITTKNEYKKTPTFLVEDWPSMNYTNHFYSFFTQILNIEEESSYTETLQIKISPFDENKIHLSAFTKPEIYFLQLIYFSIKLNKDLNLLNQLPNIFLEYSICENSTFVYCQNPKLFLTIVRYIVKNTGELRDLFVEAIRKFDVNTIISLIKNPLHDSINQNAIKLNENALIYNEIEDTLNGKFEKPLLILLNEATMLWVQILSNNFANVLCFNYKKFLNLIPLIKYTEIMNGIRGKIIINLDLNYEDAIEIIKEILYELPEMKNSFVFLIYSDSKVDYDNVVRILENQTLLYDDLDMNSQACILNSKINFQNKECLLRDIVDENCISDFEVSEIIENYDNLIIGPCIETENEFYIEKCLIPADNNQNVTSVTKNKAKEPLKQNENQNGKITIEELIKKEEKMILISDKTGTGKSTLLNHVARKFKNIKTNNWIIKVNLHQVINILEQVNIENEDFHIKFLSDSLEFTSRTENYLLRHIMKISKNMVLLLDGYDEIYPLHNEIISKLIDKFEEEEIQLWIATKPSLAETLDNSNSFKLEKFNYEDELDFFMRCFKYPENKAKKIITETEKWKTENLSKYCCAPLKIKMLAEILSDDTKLEENLKVLNVFETFKQFVTKLLGKYEETERETEGLECELIRYAHQVLAVKYLFPNEDINDIDSLGILSKINKKEINDIGLIELKIDQEEKMHVKFVNRTIADFFLAEYIIRRLKALKETKITDLEIVGNVITNIDFVNRIILIFTEPQYNSIRAFVNRFLENFDDDDDISENVKIIISTMIANLGNNYNLILHIASLENLTYILKFVANLLSKDKRNTLLKTFATFDKRNKNLQLINDEGSIWNWFPKRRNDKKVQVENDQIECTPLHLAAMFGCPDIIKLLIDLGADVNSVNNLNVSPLQLAKQYNRMDDVVHILEENCIVSDAA